MGDDLRARRQSDAAVVNRRFSLPPERSSASQARRLLREALGEAQAERWLDPAELAMSELVTNALLHAHTEIEVVIEVFERWLCVEVRDLDPTPPVQRHYGQEAMTGRGMQLVSAIATSCGVRSLGESGKVVWFCVGDDGPRSVALDEQAAGWHVEGWDDSAPEPESGVRQVVLQGMPATLWLAAREHHDAIIREVCHHLARNPDPRLDVAAADRARSIISSTLVATLTSAEEEGRTRPPVPGVDLSLPAVVDDLDLALTVPDDGGDMFAKMQDVLDAAEALAAKGRLFVHPALPEIVAVRDWACEQVISQLVGIPPTPWPGTAQERFEREVRSQAGPAPSWDPSIVTGSDRSVAAADAANRIIAVSRPFEDALGWRADEIVGRRVVTIVPARMREAHVAGFSRHVSTGEAHVLGTPLELPVLAADGREVMCRLVLERAAAGVGRAVYLAWIDPIDSIDRDGRPGG